MALTLTLEDVLANGRGSERPFCCPVHGDSNASASVNVLKGVWYCYACGASGRTDGKAKAPSVADLEAMLQPETNVRVYPEAWLELFETSDSYWHTRFAAWTVAHAQLGVDPFTGHPVFPVRTPLGLLAGVGRRIPDEEVAAAKEAGTNPSRYRYPYRWSASTVLDGLGEPRTDHVVLVEGAADRISLLEVGIPALGAYGAGLHFPQVEQLVRRAPKLVLLGFDMDDAGERAAERSMVLLTEHDIQVEVIAWPEKDPGDCSPEQRVDAVAEAVGSGVYVPSWSERVRDYTARFDSTTRE